MATSNNLNSVRHWRIIPSMVIKETQYFTDIIQQLMPDDLYAQLQEAIIKKPDAGTIIPGSGGLRKINLNYYAKSYKRN